MFTEGTAERGLTTLPALIRALDAYGPALMHAGPEVASLLTTLALEPSSYVPYLQVAPRRYTRTLVHRSPHFELLLLAWPERSWAPVHDHAGQRCWLTVLKGRLELQRYRLREADRARGYAWVEKEGAAKLLGPGGLDFRLPGAELHSVRAAAPGLSVSLHVYAGPVDACGVYDVKRRRVRLRLLRYDQIGACSPSSLSASAAVEAQADITMHPASTSKSSPASTSPATSTDPGPNPGPVPVVSTGAPVSRASRSRPPSFSRMARAWKAALHQLWTVPTLLKKTTEEFATEADVPEHSAQLSVKTLRHSYGNEVEALRNVSLNVRSGDFVCLVGPSGCGKSTLLYALAGHIRPSGGSVSLDGREVKGPGPDRLLMFQEPGLFPWLTVEGNIVFALGAKFSRAERRRRARRYIKLVQLEGFEHARPHELSGGMRMRASLARSLAMESDVLLMDEPFGSLDAQTREDMHRLLQSIWRETRKTIVFVTHDLREALTLANRVVVMAPRPGRIVRDLEIRLPFPRDPDGAELASLARQVRELFREHAERREPQAQAVAQAYEASDETSSKVDLQRYVPRSGGDGLVDPL